MVEFKITEVGENTYSMHPPERYHITVKVIGGDNRLKEFNMFGLERSTLDNENKLRKALLDKYTSLLAWKIKEDNDKAWMESLKGKVLRYE